MRRSGGKLGTHRDLRQSSVRLTVPVAGLVFVVSGCAARCAVMTVVPEIDGRFVEDGLLQGCMRPTQPGEGRNGLGEDYDQRQDVRGRYPQWPGIEEKELMGWPS